MFCSAAILSVSLLLASQSVVAVPSPSSPSLVLSLRQSTSDSDSDFPLTSIAPQCVNPCNKLNNTITTATTVIESCTNTVVSQFETCFDCELNVLAATQESLQDYVNAFVQACANLGHPVKSVTIVAKNGGERLSLGIFSSVAVGLATLFLVVL
ncbi:hypothetical protein B0H16DRAFT_1691829 [Mycena metata]|uniref:Transmembrane protein n=1 Tax=Mycena metata TaxID=1033252 RepID=A0AAD7IVU6_9AGAR|nr:hypothetical protein B0H16DRAFT_1691829 [Mycena metata]